jgi:hypothetical protein
VGLATRYYFLSECYCLKFACGTLLYKNAVHTLQETHYVSAIEPKLLMLFIVKSGYFTTDCKSVCLGIENPCGTCDQILLPAGMLLSEICGLASVGRPL